MDLKETGRGCLGWIHVFRVFVILHSLFQFQCSERNFLNRKHVKTDFSPPLPVTAGAQILTTCVDTIMKQGRANTSWMGQNCLTAFFVLDFIHCVF
jgi:hypothetical protein